MRIHHRVQLDQQSLLVPFVHWAITHFLKWKKQSESIQQINAFTPVILLVFQRTSLIDLVLSSRNYLHCHESRRFLVHHPVYRSKKATTDLGLLSEILLVENFQYWLLKCCRTLNSHQIRGFDVVFEIVVGEFQPTRDEAGILISMMFIVFNIGSENDDSFSIFSLENTVLLRTTLQRSTYCFVMISKPLEQNTNIFLNSFPNNISQYPKHNRKHLASLANNEEWYCLSIFHTQSCPWSQSHIAKCEGQTLFQNVRIARQLTLWGFYNQPVSRRQMRKRRRDGLAL